MAFEGEETSALKGRGRDGFIRTVNNLTVLGDLVVHGETRSEIGNQAAFWETADADANYWAYDLPAGGDIDVPVVGFGIGLADVDLSFFNGITQTTVAVIDADRDSFIALDFSADDASRIRANTTINITPTGALSVGTDGSGNDVIFYSGTAGDNLTWDSSEEVLQITGTNGQTSLDVLDGDVRIVDTLYFFDRGGESISSDGSTLTVAGTVVFSGSIEVQGTTTSTSSNTVVIDDPLFHLGNDNDADSVDLGIFAEYTDSGKKFAGLFRDASDSDKWKLFATTGNSHEEPSTTVNTTSGFTLANLAVNELEGTLTTAAQANITSVGTLGALQVDYLNLNASTLQITDSSDTGDLMTLTVTTHGATTLTTTDDDAAAADLTLDVDGEIVLDPADAAGTIFKLNGSAQVSIIDGVIKPASTNDIDLGTADVEFKNAFFDGTVTSDAFAGPLTGNADTATALATGRTIAMTGDVAWTSASFDGSGNVTGAGTIQSTAVESGMLNNNIISGQTELAATGIAAADEILISDAGTIKRYGVDNLIKDTPALLADTTIADGDFIVFLDGGATGTAKKEALADLVGVMAGTVTSTGLSDANSVLKLDIANMTASTTIADADLIVIDDGAGGTLRKMTRANFIESAALDAINIDGGAIDAVTLGTNSAVTEAVIDDINLNGKVITMTGSTDDTAVFTAGTHGTLTIETTDTAAAAANIQITADGTVDIDSTGILTLDSGANINLEPASGSAVLIDGVWTFDGSVATPVATAHNAAGTGVSIAGGKTTAGTTNNIAGGALTIQGGQGKGSGAGGDIIFQTANAGSSGSNLNSQATALTISDDLSSTFTGIVDLTNTTDSSDNSGDTGALRVEGGASIAKKLFVGTDLDVDGTAELDNLTIAGSQGSDGQVLTSTGSGIGWETPVGGVSATTNGADNRIVTFVNSTAINGEANLTFDGTDLQITGIVTVGVDGTGHDVKFFGATASAYLLWDESEDKLLTAGNTFVDIVKDKLMIGGTAVTTTAAELNVLDAVSAGTVTASLGVVVDSNKDIGSFRNVTLTGELVAATLDISSNIDIDGITNLDAVDIDGNVQLDGTLTVGVDDTSADVKFFGASAGAYMEWDESEDQLRIMGASADATTSTGKLLLATSLTDINANDVIGKIDFQAPHEAGGTDAITVAASIQAIAQGTFSASVNATDLIFYTGHSEAATEKFRITSQGELGIGGATYGSSGDVLTSGGAGAAPTWATPTTGDITGVTAGVGLSGGGSSGAVTVTLDLSELSDVTPANGDKLATLDSDGGQEQLTTVASLATLFAGAGMTATSSVVNVIGGDGITANANDVAITPAQTTITSIYGTDIVIGEDAQTQIDFETANEIHFDADNAEIAKITATGLTMADGENIYLGDGSSLNIATPLLAGADHTYSGISAQMLAGGAIAAFDLVCIHTTTGEVVEADASAIATARVIGIAPAAISDTATGTVLLHGFIRDDTWNWTTGAVLFLSETAGAMTETAPTTDGAFVQAVGIALEPDVVFINPSLDVIEHA